MWLHLRVCGVCSGEFVKRHRGYLFCWFPFNCILIRKYDLPDTGSVKFIWNMFVTLVFMVPCPVPRTQNLLSWYCRDSEWWMNGCLLTIYPRSCLLLKSDHLILSARLNHGISYTFQNVMIWRTNCSLADTEGFLLAKLETWDSTTVLNFTDVDSDLPT